MKPAAKSAVRFGTAVTVVIALLPYIRDFFITSYVAGALAAVWFAVRRRHEKLSFKEGALTSCSNSRRLPNHAISLPFNQWRDELFPGLVL